MNLFRKLSSFVFPKVAGRDGIAPATDVGRTATSDNPVRQPADAQEPAVVVSAPDSVADGYRANPNHSSR